jgi:enoyl-CoA hydratase
MLVLKPRSDTLSAMTTRTRYELTDGIATITMDDGKVNAMSPDMSAELLEHFDRAETEDAKVVVLTGRERTLSAGFDLKVEPAGWPAMMAAGARLSARMLSFPRPVVVACPGNAIAMGGFLLLSADHRIGADGDGRIGLNEVAIGLTLPWFAIEIARHRLPRPAFDRCTVTGVLLDPQEARALDEVVSAEQLQEAALTAARQLATIDPAAHAATKLRIRRDVLAGLDDGIARLEGDGREW